MAVHRSFWPTVLFLWASVIMMLSVIPGADLPSLSIWEPDKVMHATVYAILSLCAFKAMPFFNPRLSRISRRLYAVGLCILYGFSIELIQLLLPSRSFDLLDELANTIGCLIALAGISLFSRRSHKGSL